eukprot:CAMPEP_0201281608 /NCGR_PEP_ID=MMETSP1317-20130820/3473_1 /ASSEMBLY_ACC=CAM_ASM_000770 /TAXON_ID=187299 /ORGANISM="Undescribed Undescribed, Strain Undescribed" /LENGTH=338 /DNA_ID=CAMNT_0047591913 /DNA_START=3171 /DNA_END=4187 /DNA_ORIENTATION=+
MSKSIGNVIEPLILKDLYGLDSFRYFLAREMVFGLDSSFSEEAIMQRINSDLANDIGNLFSRVITMTHKYFGGVVPDQGTTVEEQEKDCDLGVDAKSLIDEFEKAMDSFAFHKALISIWTFINRLNKYIDTTTPWRLAKDESRTKELEFVIYNLLESLRIISGLIYPIMPDTAETMQKHLGFAHKKDFFSIDQLKKWGATVSGTKLKKNVTLFPRIKIDKDITQSDKSESIKPEINMDDFAKVDLRIATVIKAEAVPKTKKLLKLTVDIGSKRTVVAGILENYKPEELINKQVIVVANLKPAKLMGILSEGMILTATDDKSCSIGTIEKKVKPGTALK